MSIGLSPGTSEINSVTTFAGWHAAASAAAFDSGKMAANTIHLADRRAGFEQCAADRLLVRQRDPFRRKREQR